MSDEINYNVEHNQAIDAMLNEHGILVTTQRRLIAEALFARNQHITAEQLFDLVRKNGSKVSKATVYNTLGLFAEKGLVREIFINRTRGLGPARTG